MHVGQKSVGHKVLGMSNSLKHPSYHNLFSIEALSHEFWPAPRFYIKMLNFFFELQ